MIDVDANRIIENLSLKLAQQIAENAILQAQVEQLIAKRAEETEGENNGNKQQNT